MIGLQFYVISPFTGTLDFTGTALRGAFLNILKSGNPTLSEALHGSRKARIYSLTPFPFNAEFKTNFDAGATYYFRVNILDVGTVKSGVRSILLSPPEKIRLHHYSLPVRRIDLFKEDLEILMDSWTKEFKQSVTTPYRIQMQFQTPTHLSQYGSNYSCLFPQPQRVFPSLLRVWNSISQLPKFDRVSDYRDWVEANVFVSRYRLRTTEIQMGPKRKIVGFYGRITYHLQDIESPFALLTACLARFAELSNVGKNRTAGFGKVKVRVGQSAQQNDDAGGVSQNVHPT